ncbi:sulfurtransferase [Candidatus Synechococcus calcipolaris G9]|uniref:Sulfurtransferase n=1 Tax=Candidatus Synechococcus calcipolaris G9 TaxID=1497997 RepID=A0ABT6EYN5_9SYNE|nr:sulfurtransferase [Candidatus Synechococcus calcipolaris]MDG2990035.1 sulfurtransferase [Candidatus Synechococcus calcipolaris G9]
METKLLELATHTHIISAQWLHNHLEDPDLVIFDCRFDLMDGDRGEQAYRQEHIPGAHYLHLNRDLSGPLGQHGGRHPLPNPQTLAETLNQRGVTPTSQVIAYDNSRFAFAARLWWLLRWLGHDAVAILDGGYGAYKAAGYPTCSQIPELKAPNALPFIPQVRQDWVVARSGVEAAQKNPKTVILDAREPQRYRGEVEPIDPIAGHIPGALNYPWKAITNDQGFLESQEILTQHWQDIQNYEQVIVYCGSGVTACVDLLGLAQVGLDHGQLYAGSWSDWCSYST